MTHQIESPYAEDYSVNRRGINQVEETTLGWGILSTEPILLFTINTRFVNWHLEVESSLDEDVVLTFDSGKTITIPALGIVDRVFKHNGAVQVLYQGSRPGVGEITVRSY